MTFPETDLACGPTIILDALAVGIPVLASDTNGCRDYGDNEAIGLLSPPGDPVALAPNIATLLNCTDRRESMKRAIEDLGQADLSRRVFEERLSQFLRMVHNETRGNTNDSRDGDGRWPESVWFPTLGWSAVDGGCTRLHGVCFHVSSQ